jgi:Trk K+ transport system NAD-binding subunit
MSLDPWRYRARRALAARFPEGFRRNGEPTAHYIVCGGDPLAYRLVNELLAAGGVRVTVVVPPRRRNDPATDIAAIRGIQVVRAERVDAATLRLAGLESAEALALMHPDDVGNLHAALCAQEVNQRVRLVIRMYNTRLAQGVRRLFANCAVLSDAAMAAPTFAAAALGEVTPAHFRLAGRTLIVARRSDVLPQDVVCGLAVTAEPNHPEVLPADQSRADLVLAEATGRPTGAVIAARRLARQRLRRRPFVVLLRGLRAIFNRKLGMALLIAFAVVMAAGAVLARVEHLGPWDSIYFTLLTAIGGADANRDLGVVEKIAQVALTVGGLALIPLITAVVVDAVVNARLAVAAGRLRVPRENHVVVIGLGNVGTRVIRQLYDLGVEVVAIDKDAGARGVVVARQLQIPLIIGDAAQEETLRLASVQSSQAVVVMSTDDMANLQTALASRSLRPGVRVVIRLFDGDFADRVQRAFDINISRSVSYLAAPAFAAQMMEREVIATIPVDRHVLLVAEVPVAPGSALDGARVDAAGRPDGVQVIGLARFGEPRPHWAPPGALAIAARDRLIVVARRAGLAWLQEQAAEPTEHAGPTPPRPAGPTSPGPTGPTEPAAPTA